MKYEVRVVGGGHAGCEAALASARLKHKTLLVTGNIKNIADMPCNPSIGGPAKGIVVREIDALGGEMAKNSDTATIQLKMLNTKKGPAVQALRAQIDKIVYPQEMLKTLQNQENLETKEAFVKELIIKDNKIVGVKLEDGSSIKADAVILTTGTYLKAKILTGSTKTSGGPHGEKESKYLSDNLKKLGFRILRLKTGTPPRVKKDTINYEKTQLDLEKLDYINNRLGINLTIEQALKDKIVFNLLYFLYYNGINKINVSDKELNAISNYFIGFLSMDNSSIIFRNCSNKKMELESLKKRYKKYQIVGDEEDISLIKYYCIPTIIDPLSLNPINIHVAEGPFDILSICYNLNKNNRDNHIYIAAGGKGYFGAVKSIIDILKLSPNMIIHIYPDNDVDDNKLKLYLKRFIEINIPVYLHRNVFSGENDFGVRLDRIIDNCIKI